jgi:hypothetical protein
MEIESHNHAVAEGWTEIDYAPDLPMAYFVGVCPELPRTTRALDEARGLNDRSRQSL